MKTTLKSSSPTVRRLLLVGAACLAACQKTPSTTPPEQSSETRKTPDGYDDMRDLIKSKGLSPEREKKMLQSVDDDARRAEQSVLDREELVSPAAPGFKPQKAKQKIRLALKLEKTKIRQGENPRFLLEMTNIGSEPIQLLETGGSFFKSGGLSSSRDIEFILAPPDGKEIGLYTGIPKGSIPGEEIEFPAGWSRRQKEEAVAEMNSRAKAAYDLFIKLMPGETLHTRGDRPGEPYRTLRAHVEFNEIGTYRIRAKFEKDFLLKSIQPWMSPARKKEARQMRAAEILKSAESNEITFEVVP